MTHALTPDWLAWEETQTLIGAFAKHKVPLRFIGGCVRDALLEGTVVDVDAATPLAPEHVMDVLKTENIKAVPTGIDFGTITAVIGKKSFEITTLRKDTACDGRHAAVEYTEDWEEDARRRDFTINALYLSPEGKLFDYFDGEQDLKHGIVQFIGKADDRVQEDFLRILRFFRFHARYAKGVPNKEALAACKKHAPQLAMLSGERIQQEMLKLLASPSPYAALSAMAEIELLSRVVPRPEVAVLDALLQLELKAGISPKAEMRLAALMAHAGEKDIASISTRWKLPLSTSKFLKYVLMYAEQITPGITEAAQKKLLRRIGKEYYIAAVLIGAARSAQPTAYLPLFTLPWQWSPPEFPVTGGDLKAKGIPEGKALGDTLRTLEDAWEDSDYTLTKAQLLKKI